MAWAGYFAVFLINAASYLFSAGFEGFIQLPAFKNTTKVQNKILNDILEGCRYVFSRRRLMIILMMVGVIHFFVGSIEAVIPVFATGLAGKGPENIGFIQTCFGLGTVLAALFISIRNLNDKEAVLLFSSVFLIGLFLILIGTIHMAGIQNVLAFLVFFLAIGGAVIFAGTSFRSLLQKDVDANMMGRVFGFVSSVGNISIPLAILIFGLLMEYIHPRIILAISGFSLLPLSILAYNKYMGTISEQQSPESAVYKRN